MRSNFCPRRRRARDFIQFLIGHPTRDINGSLQIFVAFAFTIACFVIFVIQLSLQDLRCASFHDLLRDESQLI